jgi:AcrR family transcriptional regulator
MGRKSKAVVRKQEILEHFYTVMCNEGFENASIAKVAASMDVNPSLLIHYFKTKEEMVVELVDFFLNRYETAFVEDFHKITEPQARFDKAMNTLFGLDWLAVGDYSVFYACYYLAARHERIRERFQQMYVRFRDFLLIEAEVWLANKIVRQQSAIEITEYLMMLTEGMAFYQRLQARETWENRGEMVRRMAIKTLVG